MDALNARHSMSEVADGPEMKVTGRSILLSAAAI
jgi:hypothetical protein